MSAIEQIESQAKRQKIYNEAEQRAHEYHRPADWPAATGDIDLEIQDRPHASANTEWWYINCHVKSDTGKKFSLFASFFRIFKEYDEDGKPQHLHAISGAIVDVENKAYYPIAYVDPETPAVLKYQLNKDLYELDPRLKRAMLEIVERNNVPLPDRCLSEPAVVALDKLDLYYAGNKFYKNLDQSYTIVLNLPEENIGFEVNLKPLRKPTRQGHDGVVQVGIKRETMFYYFIPRNAVTGTITLKNEKFNISGDGWYDHEFGGGIKDNYYTKKDDNSKTKIVTDDKPAEKDNSYAWNWFSMQLDNGCEMTCTNLIDAKTGVVYDNFAVTIDSNSVRHEYPDLIATPTRSWTSARTGCVYNIDFKIQVPSANIDLTLEAEFPEQEIITLISKPSFWEGRLNVKGIFKGQQVTGLCCLERHGFDEIDSLDKFFKKISKIVNEEIRKVLPLNPTYEQSVEIMADKDNTHYMKGANTQVLNDTIIKPLREIIDRGGKSWRSYACLLCVDLVGGNSFKYQHWLAMPEIMHVGSLIVDDIQDKSETRRGGPSAHLTYGEPIAINCGTSAYFLAMDILQRRTPGLDPNLRLKLFEIYFLTLRAGHVGQAFDINGLDYLMELIVTGKEDSSKLLDSIVCTHRLKSAVPAGNLARMGALIGGGTEEQAWALCAYFESIGIAFQIIDDVLNLKGFEGNTKTKGEDIYMGKITFPVCYAMTQLSQDKKQKVWEVIKSKPTDNVIVDEVIDILESVNALDESIKIASDMVDNAWEKLDKMIPDSFYKMMLRSFGWYVLERHY